MQGYSPRQFVDITNKVDSIDREQLEDIACRETPPELRALAALKLFNKFLDLRPRETVQSSWLTSSIAVPPLCWELRRQGLLEPFQSGTQQCRGWEPTALLHPTHPKCIFPPESAPVSYVPHYIKGPSFSPKVTLCCNLSRELFTSLTVRVFLLAVPSLCASPSFRDKSGSV